MSFKVPFKPDNSGTHWDELSRCNVSCLPAPTLVQCCGLKSTEEFGVLVKPQLCVLSPGGPLCVGVPAQSWHFGAAGAVLVLLVT